MPDRFGWFLGGIVLISCSCTSRFSATRLGRRRSLLPIATLLNGIGYVEIARWNPPYAKTQTLWFFVSAVGLALTLKFVRHVRDLDRYRYLTLLAALALLVAPLGRRDHHQRGAPVDRRGLVLL
jgi:hypothetical protein